MIVPPTPDAGQSHAATNARLVDDYQEPVPIPGRIDDKGRRIKVKPANPKSQSNP